MAVHCYGTCLILHPLYNCWVCMTSLKYPFPVTQSDSFWGLYNNSGLVSHTTPNQQFSIMMHLPGFCLNSKLPCVTHKQLESDISEPRHLILDCIYLFPNICTICDSILVFLASLLQPKDSSSGKEWNNTLNTECMISRRWNLSMRWGEEITHSGDLMHMQFATFNAQICWLLGTDKEYINKGYTFP